MEKTKIDVVSGFLGAGKTTLIKKLLLEELNNENIVIIENEFGEIGIDGSILKETGVKVREISAGCICCTVSGDFSNALLEVREQYNPDRIIIEPSGVGKLSEVLNVIKDESVLEYFELNMTITVVDISKYEMYLRNFREFFADQIKYTKVVILSRTQSAETDKIEHIVSNINQEHPHLEIITTPWDDLSAKKIILVGCNDNLDLSHTLLKEECECQSNRDTSCSHQHSHEELHSCDSDDCDCNAQQHDHSEKEHNHLEHDFFSTWNLKTSRKFSMKNLTDIFEIIQNKNEYGTVLRGKGIVQNEDKAWIQFSYVPDEINITKVDPDYIGRLCFIGVDLNKEKLDVLFGVS